MNSSGSSRLSSQPLFCRVNPGQVRQRLKTKSQSSFSGPPSRKLTLTIPQAQHQLSSSNHSALSVYSYCDLLTNNLIINNAKEWRTIATIWSKTPEGTIFQGHNVHTTNESKSISFSFIPRHHRYLAILFKSIFCIHDIYLHCFLTFLKSSSLNKQEMVSQKERTIWPLAAGDLGQAGSNLF